MREETGFPPMSFVDRFARMVRGQSDRMLLVQGPMKANTAISISSTISILMSMASSSNSCRLRNVCLTHWKLSTDKLEPVTHSAAQRGPLNQIPPWQAVLNIQLRQKFLLDECCLQPGFRNKCQQKQKRHMEMLGKLRRSYRMAPALLRRERNSDLRAASASASHESSAYLCYRSGFLGAKTRKTPCGRHGMSALCSLDVGQNRMAQVEHRLCPLGHDMSFCFKSVPVCGGGGGGGGGWRRA